MALSALSVGDSCLDRYLPPIDATFVGGQAVNVAVGLARQGLQVAWAGVVGSDDAGRRVLHALGAWGVELSLARVLTGPTGVTLIGVDANGDRHIVDERYGVSARVIAGPDVLARAGVADVVFAAHVANLDALAAAVGSHAAFGVDLSEEALPDGRWLARVRYLFVSRPGASLEEVETEARRAMARGVREVVCTRGAAGALVVGADGVVAAPTVAQDIVDTLGAGDAHAACYMAERLAGRSVAVALTAAALAAADACRHLGAWPLTPAIGLAARRVR